MKKIILIFVIGVLLTSSAYARDSIDSYSIKEVLSLESSKSTLGGEVGFYFGNQIHRKANAFGKSDKEACQRAFYHHY